jgi:hypothetical protein
MQRGFLEQALSIKFFCPDMSMSFSSFSLPKILKLIGILGEIDIGNALVVYVQQLISYQN